MVVAKWCSPCNTLLCFTHSIVVVNDCNNVQKHIIIETDTAGDEWMCDYNFKTDHDDNFDEEMPSYNMLITDVMR